LWKELPRTLTLRVICFRVETPGFRTEKISLVTSLLDTVAYPDTALAELYLRRWRVEMYYRDIKCSLGLEVLRCTTPEMVEKEIWMQAIARNMMRAIMPEAAISHGVDLDRLSFKVWSIRCWLGHRSCLPADHARPKNISP
jgi:Transposase DDE domain